MTISTLVAVLCLAAPLLSQDVGEPQNETCPVMEGEWNDPDYTVVYQGVPVGLCCPKCRRLFKADPGAYLDLLPQFGGRATPAVKPSADPEAAPKHGHDEEDGHEEPAPAEDAEPAEEPEHDADDVLAPIQTAGFRMGLNQLQSDQEVASEPSYVVRGDVIEQVEPVDLEPAQHPEHEESDAPVLLDRLGRLHPLLVHFPIALLWAAGLAELLYMAGRWTGARAAVSFCMITGTLGAVFAVGLGLAAHSSGSFRGALAEVVLDHRMAGLVCAGLALVSLGFLYGASRKDAPPAFNLAFRVCLVLTLAVTMIAGHLGATLVFGPGFLTS